MNVLLIDRHLVVFLTFKEARNIQWEEKKNLFYCYCGFD